MVKVSVYGKNGRGTVGLSRLPLKGELVYVDLEGRYENFVVTRVIHYTMADYNGVAGQIDVDVLPE